jgi:hypothetical protein
MIFPDQTIPDSERDEEWFRSHHTYVDKLWNKGTKRLSRINKAYDAFHGKYSKAKSKEWTDRYKTGNTNLSNAKFKHYKLASTKLERLHGEYIKRPLRPSVEVTNKEALTEKMRNLGLQMAMKQMAPIMEQMKRDMGVELLEGVQQVDLDDPEQVEALNPKIEYEKYMTVVIREQIDRLSIKQLGAQTLLDCLIASECHAVPYLEPNKKVSVQRIHPRNSIFEEIENDEFLENSTILGYKVEMSQSDILRIYGAKLSKEEKEQIRTLSNKPNDWTSGDQTYFWEKENELVGWVEHLKWKSQKEVYEKVEKSKNNEFVDFYENILSNDYYKKNKKQIEKDVKAGKYELRKGYLTTIYESTRIGKNIFVDQREMPYIITRDDDDIVFYNQTGLLFNTVDGRRLSLQEKLYDLDELYDIVMWQIRREIGKHKGSVTVIDRKFFDESVSDNDILFNIAEEGVVITNSASEEIQANPMGSVSSSGVASQSVGALDTLQQLLSMKIDIERMIDRISGINEYMEGTAPVSATATQNVQAQEAGTTITSPIFYYHNLFVQGLLYRILELTKYSIGYLGDDSFDEILGDDGMSVFKKLADVHLHDFGVKLPDPNREAQQRQRLQMWASAGINSRELQTYVAMEADLAETIQEATQIIKQGFKTVEESRKQEQEAQLASQERNVQATQQAQQAMHEDAQKHDKEMAILEDDLEKDRLTQEAKQKALLEQQKVNNQPPPNRKL